MDNSFLDYDAETAARLAGAMDLTGGAIRLPFPAPTFIWMNGSPNQAALAQSVPSLYFGGWRVYEENIAELDNERGPLPSSFAPAELMVQNEQVNCLTTRLLVVAPIIFRRRWIVDQGGRPVYYQAYPEGVKSNQHMQILAMLGLKQQDNSYKNWGTILLAIYGTQVQNILRAMNDWSTNITRALKKYAPSTKIPASAFYMCLGSIGIQVEGKGNRPKIETVGKQGASHAINPIELFLPKEITDKTLKAIFVGKETMKDMAARLDEAQDWAKAWTQPAANQAATVQRRPTDEDDFIPPEPAMEDEIPF